MSKGERVESLQAKLDRLVAQAEKLVSEIRDRQEALVKVSREIRGLVVHLVDQRQFEGHEEHEEEPGDERATNAF